jgi:hypothetical protein
VWWKLMHWSCHDVVSLYLLDAMLAGVGSCPYISSCPLVFDDGCSSDAGAV